MVYKKRSTVARIPAAVEQVKKSIAVDINCSASFGSPGKAETAVCEMPCSIVQEKAESLNVAACGAICMYLSAGGFDK